MSIESTQFEQAKRDPLEKLRSEVAQVAFRDYLLASDLNMILNSWMTRNRRFYEFLPDRVYYVGMQKLIGALAMESKVVIAHAPGNENEILGWVCYVPQGTGSLLVHYTYVKHRYRRFGLGHAMLGQAGLAVGGAILASHQWDAPKATRKKYNYFYNPCFKWKGH